jgi:hypothetical protein
MRHKRRRVHLFGYMRKHQRNRALSLRRALPTANLIVRTCTYRVELVVQYITLARAKL